MFTLVMLGTALALAAIGTWMLLGGQRRRRTDRAFVRDGVHTTALVVEIRQRHGHPATREATDRPWFHPVVELVAPDGQTIRAESLTGGKPAPAKVGDTVRVVHDRADPSRVAVVAGMARPGAVGCGHIFIGAFFIGFALLTLALWFLLKVLLEVPI